MVKPTPPTAPEAPLRSDPAFSTKAQTFLTWLAGGFNTYVEDAVDYVDERADEALAAATTFGFPSIAGRALNFTRVNSGATALEFRTPAQVRSDIGLEGIWRPEASTTVSGSAVASVVFTLPTWASDIRVEWSKCQPSGGAAPFIAQISQDGGTTYLTGTSDYGGVIQGVRSTGALFAGMPNGRLELSPGILTTQSIDGYIQMRRAAGAASDIGSWGIDDIPARFRTVAHGGGGTVTPTHIRFVYTGQNIAVGSTFNLFGRA